MENTREYNKFKKKITSFIDGSLSADELLEFEAFVSLHPQIQEEIDNKKNEIDLLKSLMPKTQLTEGSKETLEEEMKTSIFNLIDEEPQGIIDSIRIKFENWANR